MRIKRKENLLVNMNLKIMDQKELKEKEIMEVENSQLLKDKKIIQN